MDGFADAAFGAQFENERIFLDQPGHGAMGRRHVCDSIYEVLDGGIVVADKPSPELRRFGSASCTS